MTPKAFITRRKKFWRTKAAAARYIGVSFQAVALWEKGQRPIQQPIEVILDLHEALYTIIDQIERGGPVDPATLANAKALLIQRPVTNVQ